MFCIILYCISKNWVGVNSLVVPTGMHHSFGPCRDATCYRLNMEIDRHNAFIASM